MIFKALADPTRHAVLDTLRHALIDPGKMQRHPFVADRVERDGDTYTSCRPDGVAMPVNRMIHVEPRSRIEATVEMQQNGPPPSRQVVPVGEEGAPCRLTIEHHGLPGAVVPNRGRADGWPRRPPCPTGCPTSARRRADAMPTPRFRPLTPPAASAKPAPT